MLREHRLVVLLTVIVMTVIPAFLSGISEAGVIFLLIEPGSRPGSMGSAYVAQVDDAFAGYWNTGAMAFNRKNQFAGMHSNWLGDVPGVDDMYYEYLGWNSYLPELGGNIGFNIIYMNYGEQTRTDESGTDLGKFQSYEIAPTFTYATQYTENIGLGIAFKFIHSDLSPDGTGETESGVKGQGQSFAFDLGYKQKNLLLPNLDFGVNVQNLGPHITYINEDQKDPLPANLRLGFSYRMVENEFNKFTINGDMNKLLFYRLLNASQRLAWDKEFESVIFNAGAEYVYWNLLAMRAGYISDREGKIEGLSFGAGFQYTMSNQYKISLDFALQQAGELTDYNKTFSLGLEF